MRPPLFLGCGGSAAAAGAAALLCGTGVEDERSLDKGTVLAGIADASTLDEFVEARASASVVSSVPLLG